MRTWRVLLLGTGDEGALDGEGAVRPDTGTARMRDCLCGPGLCLYNNDMPSRLPRRALLGLALKAPLLAVACGSAQPSVALPTAAGGDSALRATTVTPIPPTATPVPATSTPPPPPLLLAPASIPQGGFAIVVLNEAASSATATFQGRQYPMLRAGERSWAVVGTGAFTAPDLYAVNVSYTPPGRAPASLVTSLSVARKDYPVENIQLDAQTASLLAADIIQAELAKRASIYSGYTAQRLWTGPFVRPNAGVLSSIYGEGRSYNGAPVTDYHRGTDFAGEAGSPVLAAAAGKVAFTGELKVRGNSVMVDHGAGVFTAYHHLSRIDATAGQTIAAGQQVGLLGSTGLVTGPHLHWEVVIRGIEVDGQLWLGGQEYGL